MTHADSASAALGKSRDRKLPAAGATPPQSEPGQPEPAAVAKTSGLTLDEVRALHPGWTIDYIGRDLACQSEAWRFRAADPDDVHKEIQRRENSGLTVEQLGQRLADPGFGQTRGSW